MLATLAFRQFGEAGAVIGDADDPGVLRFLGGNVDSAFLPVTFVDAVLDGVLHQRLQRHVRDVEIFRFQIVVYMNVREADLLNGQVALQMVQLLPERDHRVGGGAVDVVPQIIGETVGHFLRGLRVFRTEAGNGGQRIVDQVRIDLQHDRVQLALRELLLDAQRFAAVIDKHEAEDHEQGEECREGDQGVKMEGPAEGHQNQVHQDDDHNGDRITQQGYKNTPVADFPEDHDHIKDIPDPVERIIDGIKAPVTDVTALIHREEQLCGQVEENDQQRDGGKHPVDHTEPGIVLPGKVEEGLYIGVVKGDAQYGEYHLEAVDHPQMDLEFGSAAQNIDDSAEEGGKIDVDQDRQEEALAVDAGIKTADTVANAEDQVQQHTNLINRDVHQRFRIIPDPEIRDQGHQEQETAYHDGQKADVH